MIVSSPARALLKYPASEVRLVRLYDIKASGLARGPPACLCRPAPHYFLFPSFSSLDLSARSLACWAQPLDVYFGEHFLNNCGEADIGAPLADRPIGRSRICWHAGPPHHRPPRRAWRSTQLNFSKQTKRHLRANLFERRSHNVAPLWQGDVA